MISSAAIRNLFSRKLKTSKRVPSRRSPTRPLLELLEARDVPTASVFVPGSIQGQDGWTGGAIPISTSVDQAVDQSALNAHLGAGAWHVSNNTSNGNHNGAFGGWVFSPGLSVAAGQPSSGAQANQFRATFFFRSANTVADGSNIELDLGNTAGTDRATFMAITNKADANGGLQLRMAEPNPADAGSDYFYPTQIVATKITRGVWHRIDIQASFIDGSSNDTFQVRLDGVAITNPTPGSPNNGTPAWGTFEGYNEAHGSAYAQTNRLLFRSGGAPSAYGSFSDTGAQGFYIDDVNYKDWNSSAPSTILASYTATFEKEPSTIYVNASWAGMTVGSDPDGAGPATAFGSDAFASIQAGVDAVAAGGTVYVAAGAYSEKITVNKSVSLLGAQADVDARNGRGPESVLDGLGGVTPLYITASNVTVNGFTIQGNTSGNQFGFGILLGAGTSGSQVLNNIIQNNVVGLGLANNSAVNQTVIQNNLFRNNNNDGPAGGNAIYSDEYVAGGALTNVLIDANRFEGHDDAALNLSATVSGSQSAITFSNNDVVGNGRAAFLFNVVNSTFSNNSVSGSTLAASADFRIYGGVQNVSFTGNLLSGGAGDAIRISDSSGSNPNSGILVKGSSITGYVGDGLEIAGGAAAVDNNTISANGTGIHVTNGGSLTSVTENFITGNTGDGILITATAGSVAPVFNNDLSGNGGLAVNNQSATTVDAVGNWWGTSTAAGVAAEVSGNVDFMPFLLTGVDTNAETGFQGDFSVTPGEGSVRVKVVGKRLVITGDNLDNLITVEKGPTANSYRVTGLNGTQINGRSGSFVFNNVTKGIDANLMGGDDMLVLDGSASPFGVPGTIKVRTGPGADLVRLQGVTGKGDLGSSSGKDVVQLIDSVFTALAVDLGNGASTSLLLDGVTVIGRTKVRGGNGADTVRAIDSNLAAVLIQTGLGSDTVRLENVHATGRVYMGTGRGADLVAVSNSKFDAAVVLFGDRGHDVLDAGTLGNSNTKGNTFLVNPLTRGFEDFLS